MSLHDKLFSFNLKKYVTNMFQAQHITIYDYYTFELFWIFLKVNGEQNDLHLSNDRRMNDEIIKHSDERIYI